MIITYMIYYSIGAIVLGFAIGYYFGLKNYKFSPREKNIIEIEVKTDAAIARLQELKREAIHVQSVIEKIKKP